MKDIIENIESKLIKFLEKHKQLDENKVVLENENKNLSLELSVTQDKVLALEDKIRLMSMSKSVKNTEEEVKLTRLKINEYVREIDKCIALLNN